jgi:hypothetical protein
VIYADARQLFWVPEKNQWVAAGQLTQEDRLCGYRRIVVPIESVEIINQPTKVHTLSVNAPHIFCLAPDGIVVHNIVPFIGIGLSFLFGAGVVEFARLSLLVGSVVVGSAIGIKKLKNHTTNAIITPVADDAYKSSKCFIPENRQPERGDRSITIEAVPCASVPIGFTRTPQNSKAVDCTFTASPQEPTLHCMQQHNEQKEKNKPCYQGLYARNWAEFFRECPVGQKYKDHFINTGKQNPKDGGPIWLVIKDVPDSEMFKEGNMLALDKLHKDHMEVWDGKGNWIGVANLDGTKNVRKAKSVENKAIRNLNKK